VRPRASERTSVQKRYRSAKLMSNCRPGLAATGIDQLAQPRVAQPRGAPAAADGAVAQKIHRRTPGIELVSFRHRQRAAVGEDYHGLMGAAACAHDHDGIGHGWCHWISIVSGLNTRAPRPAG
jgi:hypothetical protein